MTSFTPTPAVRSTPEEHPRRPRRVWLWVLEALVAIAGLVVFAIWLIPPSTATQIEVFDGEVDQLVIDVTGGVDLVAGNSTELTITRQWLFAGEPTVTVDHQSGVARVEGECSWYQISCSTSVSGTVSADAIIEVLASAGSISVAGTTSAVDLETSAGSVNVDDITGKARLVTSAGDITGTVADGDVEAETSAGRIELTVLGEFTSLSASTSAGNVDLTVPDDVYDVDADTSAGSVNINVRTDPSAGKRIIAESSAGSIKIDTAP
jgi:DUF4097 and DUF4098 domain-containing protein YvlB